MPNAPSPALFARPDSLGIAYAPSLGGRQWQRCPNCSPKRAFSLSGSIGACYEGSADLKGYTHADR